MFTDKMKPSFSPPLGTFERGVVGGELFWIEADFLKYLWGKKMEKLDLKKMETEFQRSIQLQNLEIQDKVYRQDGIPKLLGLLSPL